MRLLSRGSHKLRGLFPGVVPRCRPIVIVTCLIMVAIWYAALNIVLARARVANEQLQKSTTPDHGHNVIHMLSVLMNGVSRKPKTYINIERTVDVLPKVHKGESVEDIGRNHHVTSYSYTPHPLLLLTNYSRNNTIRRKTITSVPKTESYANMSELQDGEPNISTGGHGHNATRTSEDDHNVTRTPHDGHNTMRTSQDVHTNRIPSQDGENAIMTSNNSTAKRILIMKTSLSTYLPGFKSCSGLADHKCVMEFYEEASDPGLSDAIIVPLSYTPPPRRNNTNQIFVFFNFESPLNIRSVRVNQQDVFNLTISYLDHPDTDIFTPYGLKSIRSVTAPIDEIPTSEYISKKTKLIAWLVSHCNSTSARMDYVQELTKYIPVDIYGGCGNSMYPRGNSTWKIDFSRDYKFYLSFESALCTDYVTEKLLYVLTLPIVPITLGLVNYSKYLPPHSHIDVRDHKSPRHLAKYLYHLHNHPEEYRAYFTWKKEYVMLQRKETRQNAYCRLCSILHNSSYVYKTRFDTRRYWDKDRQCISGDAAKKFIHLT